MRIIVRLTQILLILSIIHGITINTIYACRCAQPKSIRDYYDRADIVFEGEVIEKSDKLPPLPKDTFNHYKVKFKVKQYWKGELKNEVTIVDYDNTCSLYFEKGKSWIVYAKGEYIATNSCDGTVRADMASAHFKSLGQGTIIKQFKLFSNN